MKTFLNQNVLPIDRPNWNGRTYPRHEVERAIQLNTIGVGVIGMEPVSICNISHTIEDLRIEDGWLMCTAKTTETPSGIVLESIDEDELYFAISGIGDVDENGIVTNFQISSINAMFFY